MNRLTNIESRQRKNRKHDYLFASFVLAIFTLLAFALSACAVDDDTLDPNTASIEEETSDLPSHMYGDLDNLDVELAGASNLDEKLRPPRCTSVANDKPCTIAITEQQ